MNGNKSGLPPELIILKKKLGELKQKMGQFKVWGFFVFILILLLVFLPSMFFSIEPHEDGVVQRFGKYARTVGSGLHFKLPVGIEKVTKLPSRAVHKEEFGFRTKKAAIRTEYEKKSNLQKEESIMLTGDLSVADVEWVVQYEINDPQAFLFNVRNVIGTIRHLSESTVRQIIGDLDITEVLTSQTRNRIELDVQEKLQNKLKEYKTGIKITAVKFQNVFPPAEVQPAFHEVNAAKQEQEKLINEARKLYNQIIPEAYGKAKKTITIAEGYAIERINNAKGNAQRFIAMQKEYSKAPQVTQKRLYLETMKEIMGKVDQVYIFDPKAKSLVPLFNLDKRSLVPTTTTN